jgi:outer membrane receptor protein involved in Fe transport
MAWPEAPKKSHVPVGSLGTAAWELQYDAERATVWETTTDAYTLVNFNLSTGEFLGGVRANLGIRNLFDTSYQTPGGWEHAQMGIPQVGRTLRLTADVRF